MDNSKEGGFINRPPVLDGTNYDYWKAHMIAFLKSIDIKNLKAIIKGWKHHVVMDKYRKTTTDLRPEEDWSEDKDELALGNSKVLNALFNVVDKNMFRLINTCTVVKDAWKILKTTHEGTSKVRLTKIFRHTLQQTGHTPSI